MKMKTLLVREGEDIKEVAVEKFLSAAAKEAGVKPAQRAWADELWKIKVAGGDFDPSDDLSPDERKIVKKLWSLIEAGVREHVSLKNRANKDAMKARELELVKQDSIIKAGPMGAEIAEAVAEDSLDTLRGALRKVSGGAFDIGETGLKEIKGAKLSLDTMAHTFGSLLNMDSKLEHVRTALKWGIGDAILELRALFPEDADNVIETICRANGKQKHTIRESLRVCEYYDGSDEHKKRSKGLSFTHHQELMNYSKLVKPSKIIEIRDAAIKGNDECVMKLSTGKEIRQTEPLSCAATRHLLQEAAGKKKAAPEPKAQHGPAGFIYIQGGKAYYHKGLSLKALADCDLVIDLKDMEVILQSDPAGDGEKLAELPAAYFKADEPKPQKEAKPNKPKKPDLPE